MSRSGSISERTIPSTFELPKLGPDPATWTTLERVIMPRFFDEELVPFGSAEEPSEYRLPCPSDIVELLKGLDARLAHFAQFDENNVHKLLSSWWANISHPPLVEFRNRLLDFHPVGISIFENIPYLRIKLPQKNQNSLLYLGSAIDDVRLRETLATWSLGETSIIHEFYTYFPRLRDISPEFAGEFIQPPSWERFEEFGWSLSDEDEVWAPSIVLFNACDGDLLLLSDEGVAWAVLSTGQLWKFCDSFSSFIQLYARFLRTKTSLDYFAFKQFLKC
jgi:hypothetical protein